LNKNTRNIIVVVESIDVNRSSGAKMNVALIKNLAKIGYQLKVLHYSRKEIQLEGISCISILEKKNTIYYYLSRLQRVFTRTTKIRLHKIIENNFGFSFAFFNDTNSIKNAVLKEINTTTHFVLTLSQGASFRPHYAVLQLPELHSKWLAYIHDPYPFIYYPPPYDWLEPGYKQKINFFKELSEKAKYTAFPSKLLKEWMGNYFSNMLTTGIVIPHQNAAIETNDIKLPNYFSTKKFTLLHAGNLMKQRNPKGLLEGFLLFLKNNKNANKEVQLLLLGAADYHQKLLDKYDSVNQIFLKTSNTNFNEVYKMQQQASVNIILEAKAEVSPFLPGKFPHCVMANKPILHLGPIKSETMRLLGKNYLYHSEIDDVITIANIIEKLYKQWKGHKNEFLLNRPDLLDYVSEPELKRVFTKLDVSYE